MRKEINGRPVLRTSDRDDHPDSPRFPRRAFRLGFLMALRRTGNDLYFVNVQGAEWLYMGPQGTTRADVPWGDENFVYKGCPCRPVKTMKDIETIYEGFPKGLKELTPSA